MAEKIGTRLVREGIISQQQLEEALRVQVVYGGRLGTNLVELGYVTAEVFAEWLGRQSGLPHATRAQLEAVPADVVALLPRDMAEKHECFPVRREGRKLSVAMAQPQDLAAIDALSFASGMRVSPVVAAEFDISYAMEKRYGIPRKERHVRASLMQEEARRAAQKAAAAAAARAAASDWQPPSLPEPPPASAPPAPAPAAAPAAATAARADEAATIPDLPALPDLGTASPTLDIPTMAAAALAAAAPPAASAPQAAKPRSDAPARSAPPPRRAPARAMNPREVGVLLAAASTREDVADALVRFSAGRADSVVVFQVRDEMALGWRGAGTGVPADAVESLMLPLNVPSMFRDAMLTRAPASGAVPDSTLHKQLVRALRREAPPASMAVVPVVLLDRVVNLVYLDRAASDDAGQAAAAVAEVAARAAGAYERILRESRQKKPA